MIGLLATQPHLFLKMLLKLQMVACYASIMFDTATAIDGLTHVTLLS